MTDDPGLRKETHSTYGPTLDEILEREGVTREEWQRNRSLVEDYWEPFARANGWEKRGHPARASQRVFRFPLYPDGEFTITAPLSDAQWSVLMDVLVAAKPGLISDGPGEGIAE